MKQRLGGRLRLCSLYRFSMIYGSGPLTDGFCLDSFMSEDCLSARVSLFHLSRPVDRFCQQARRLCASQAS